jgi:hypothetical protein
MAGAAPAAGLIDIDEVFERMRAADILRPAAADTKDEGASGTVTANAEALRRACPLVALSGRRTISGPFRRRTPNRFR